MKSTCINSLVFFGFLLILSVAVSVMGGGNLNPPPEALQNGTPVAIMKSLDEIEPRVPITELPFSITNPGSYYFTTSLKGTNGITILSNDVQLDLGGFALKGETNSSTSAIEIGAGIANVTIRSGAISDWMGFGIAGADAEQVKVIDIAANVNGAGGIKFGKNSLATGCIANRNGGTGIQVGESGTVRECKASDNQQDGISAGFGTTIVGCTVTWNKKNGISTDIYCTIRDCSAVNNTNDGVEVSSSCRAEGNNIGDNGKGGGGGSGIHVAGPGNRIKDNNVTANLWGINVDLNGVGNWIENNNVVDNDIGIWVKGTGNFIIRNGVGTPLNTNNPVHFQIGPNNQCAAVLENQGGAFTNSNPWSNVRLTNQQ